MDTVLYLTGIIVAAIIPILTMLVVVAKISHKRDRRAVPTKYEWLKVLEFEPKTVLQIRQEMERIKNRRGFIPLVYRDLQGLQAEGLAWSNTYNQTIGGYTIPRLQYWMTAAGKIVRDRLATTTTAKT